MRQYVKACIGAEKYERVGNMYFNTNDKYITPEEVADELGLSLTTVYNLLRKGQLPGVKVGRKWLILREKIERIC